MMIDRTVDRIEGWASGTLGAMGRRIAERVLFHAARMRDARYLGFTLVIPFLALVAVPLWLADSVALNRWIFDYAMPLDMSLRWLHGHVPHLDFQTPVGVTYWLIQGWATDLMGGVDARTPIVANFLAVVPIVVGAWILLRPRLSGGLLGLAVLASVLFVISPRSPGDIPGEISFLAAYNKIGLSLLAVLLLAMFVEPRQVRTQKGRWLDGAVIGFFLLWLIYLKVTFAAVAVLGIIAAFHYAPWNRFSTGLAVAIACAGIILVDWFAGINAAYFGDVSSTAAAGPAIRYGKMLRDIADSRLTIVLYLACLVIYWRLSVAAPAVKRANVIVSLGLFVAGVVAMNQVHDNALAVSYVALLVLAQSAIDETAYDDEVRRWKSFMPPLIGAVALIMTSMLADAVSSARYYSATKHGGVGSHPSSFCDDPEIPVCRIVYQVFDTSEHDWVRPLPNPTFAATTGTVDVAERDADHLSIAAMLDMCNAREDCVFWKVQEQLYQLLNQHMQPGDKPLFLGFSNILPYAYQVEPPKHIPAWLDVNRNISADAHPEPEVIFKDVTLLAVPQVYFQIGRISGLNDIYKDDIPSFFDLVAETDSWQIWRKR